MAKLLRRQPAVTIIVVSVCMMLAYGILRDISMLKDLHHHYYNEHHEGYDCRRVNRQQEGDGRKKTKYSVLVTGGAGFIGMHTCLELRRLGHSVVSYDNVNAYYSTELKQKRIDQLVPANITFIKGDVCDVTTLEKTIREYKIERVIHLAAQAGVRYSLDHPLEYTRNNVDCFVSLLETWVKLGGDKASLKRHPIIYASSSSVYGLNTKIPFAETDPVDLPASLYAATKRSMELIGRTYFNLYGLTSVGLRFFTVYGPWGRPDMAPFIFTDRVSRNETIRVFNHGESLRDFTYVDDVVDGIVSSLHVQTGVPELINLGNSHPVKLGRFVHLIEENVGQRAVIDSVSMQQGDVPVTYAKINKAACLLGYNPKTSIEDGLKKFVKWFKEEDASQYRMG